MLENVRFKDKKALAEYDLNIELFSHYDFNIIDIMAVRKVYILITDKGNKILKMLNYGIEEIKFIHSGLEYAKKNSFDRVFNFTLTKEGNPYILWGDKIYCIMELIEGRESEYSNPIDVHIASTGLGELHKACEGFRYDKKTRYTCGKTIENFKRKLQEMELFRNLARISEDKNEFDTIFLDNVSYYLAQMEQSIKFLENSSFYKLCSQEDKIVLCHNDLAHHNILIKDDKAYFVDFDYSRIDLRVQDLYNFINKVGKGSAYDIEETKIILKDYSLNNELSQKELEVLYGLLMFPEDFFNICKDYYTRKKDWEYGMFLDRLIKKNDFKEDRREFLQCFKDKILS